MKHLRVAILALFALCALAPAPALAAPPWNTLPSWAALTDADHARIEKFAAERPGYGPCTGTLAACFDGKNRQGTRLARLVVYLVEKDASDEDLAKIVEDRRASYNAEPRAIDVSQAPLVGEPGAPVTIVEFADFECPACAGVSPLLRSLAKDSGGKVKLYFKHYPLKNHKTSVPAAMAAIAAQRSGKFWDMADQLFVNIDAHEHKDLETYAGKVGIPLDAFRAGLAAPGTLKTIETDKAQGMTLGVHVTPSLFINGREFKPVRDRLLLQDRIDEELERLEGKK